MHREELPIEVFIVLERFVRELLRYEPKAQHHHVLCVPTKELMERIRRRARPGETIPVDYIDKLNTLYDQLVINMERTQHLVGTHLVGEHNITKMKQVVDRMRSMLQLDDVASLLERMSSVFNQQDPQ
jgi:deoxyadenosine/deoxycytidine kinase